MKTLGIMLVVGMLMAVPASALVLFEENFDGVPNEDLSTLGWTQKSGPAMTISDTEIDDGFSVLQGKSGTGGSVYTKDIIGGGERTLGVGEWFELTWVAQSPNDYASVFVRNDAETHHTRGTYIA